MINVNRAEARQSEFEHVFEREHEGFHSGTHSAAAASFALGQNVLEKLSKAERVGWEWLATKEKTNSSEYAESLKLPYRTAMNHLKKFQNLCLLEKSGSGRAIEYTIHPQ